MAGLETSGVEQDGFVDQLVAEVESSRLVTLTGAPGVGKSALARHVADRLAEHGMATHVVDVGAIADPASLADAVAAVPTGDGPSALVLDNCEHMVATVASLAHDLLRSWPDLRILAASRERLRVVGEVVRRVTPQRQPHAGTEADFSPAEAMVRSEAPLRAPERVLLRRLSVFAGSFDLDAARHVCPGPPLAAKEVLDVLTRLVDKSLVEAETAAERARYRLPAAVRHHAAARLAESAGDEEEEEEEEEALRSRHAAWYVGAVEALPRVGIQRHRHVPWVARLEADHDDLRVALDWAVSRGEADTAARLARGQLVFWRLTGRYREGREALDAVLAMSQQTPPELRAGALHDAGFVAAMLADFPAARRHLEQSLAFVAHSDPKGAASARVLLGVVSLFADDPASALNQLEGSVERARGARDDYALAEALAACGMARMFRSEAAEAAAAFEESIVAAERAGDEAQVADGLIGMGWVGLARAEFDEAARHLGEGLDLATELGEKFARAVALGWLGELARFRGESDEARQRLDESRDLARAMGTPYPLARSLLTLGRLALDEGDFESAEAWLAEASSVATSAQLKPVVAVAMEASAELALVGGKKEAAARFEEALEAARRIGDQATMARCLSGLGRAARGTRGLDRAWVLQHQALGAHHEIGDRAGVVDSFDELAGLALRQAGPQVAARLFGAADALRQHLGYPRPRLATEARQRDLDALARAIKPQALEAALAEGAAMTLTEVVSYVARGRGPRRKPGAGWGSLTSTEVDVVTLAAQGLTNAEIAQRLVMSRETVKTHLNRAFAKLGVRSRRELPVLVQSGPGDAPNGQSSPILGDVFPSSAAYPRHTYPDGQSARR